MRALSALDFRVPVKMTTSPNVAKYHLPRHNLDIYTATHRVFHPMTKVLLLDGNQRSALASVRSLGARGVAVVVGESGAESLAGSSRYGVARVDLPSASEQPSVYVQAVGEIIARHNIGVVLPMTDISTATVLRHHAQFGNVALPCPTWETYDAATNKCRLFRRAIDLGLPCPATVFADNIADVAHAAQRLGFPLVIKPAYSRYLQDGRWVSTRVSILRSPAELANLSDDQPWLREQPFMVQEFVHGQGQGLFALYNRGRPVTFFCHRRIREKPPSGGVSVLSESAPVDSRMRDIAEKLLGSLDWHGVAMVEFKVAEDGTPYLMEINARFWGSLQLAVDAGVDFPFLAYQLALNEEPLVPRSFQIGVRSRWLLGDLDRLYLLLKDKHTTRSQKLRDSVEFMKLLQSDTRYEVNRWDDMGPFWFELRKWVRDLR